MKLDELTSVSQGEPKNEDPNLVQKSPNKKKSLKKESVEPKQAQSTNQINTSKEILHELIGSSKIEPPQTSVCSPIHQSNLYDPVIGDMMENPHKHSNNNVVILQKTSTDIEHINIDKKDNNTPITISQNSKSSNDNNSSGSFHTANNISSVSSQQGRKNSENNCVDFTEIEENTTLYVSILLSFIVPSVTIPLGLLFRKIFI